MEVVTDFLFLGSKVTVGDCSHEIRRQLILGRKAMANLDSVLKSRDITLLTKVHVVKAITKGCESWTIRNALELMPSNYGAGEYSLESLEQQDQTSQS